MPRSSTYDIFAGSPDWGFVWVEAAADLDAASRRLKELSVSRPGPYFVYCCHTQSVVTRVDTSRKAACG